ncbi:hypothetical protein [Psychromonas sp. MME2]|uniref:hypothetical protein n=1 Tax=unclassified Psychromonas TaxID=2614957 RepID=UPI00339CBB39
MSFKITALQIAYEMQRNRKFYTRRGLATDMGIQYQYSAKIFKELEENPIYIIRIQASPYSIKVLKISAAAPSVQYDAANSRDALAKLRKRCWDLALGMNASQGV